MVTLNGDPAAAMRQWGRLQPDELAAMEAQLQRTIQSKDDFVRVPFPRLASRDDRAVQAAVAAYQKETAIMDARLARKMSLAFKGIAFSDLCRVWQEQTGIAFVANRSVADDKLTIFCKGRPLRDIMGQITRLFGFVWLRSGEEGAYKYEIAQDLKSRLLEEELRNKDRHEALIALDREMERYRKFLSLSPSEAKAKAAGASDEDKKLLESLSRGGWAPVHLYFSLTPEQMTAFQNGQTLTFGVTPDFGQQTLPTDVKKGLIESFGDWKLVKEPNGDITMVVPRHLSGVISSSDGFHDLEDSKPLPDGVVTPLDSFSDVDMMARLHLDTSEVGQMSLDGRAKFSLPSRENNRFRNGYEQISSLAVGVSPSVRNPNNAEANAKWAHDPAFRPRVTIVPKAASLFGDGQPPLTEKVTTAELLQAFYEATGKDIIADYYTRLVTPQTATARDATLFDALNTVCDTLRLRWSWGDDWLKVRSAGFFNDRVKEVPNRLLERWAASRREHGALTADDLSEISELTNAQLDAQSNDEGAKLLYGLSEWGIATTLRDHWRFVDSLSVTQRREALSATGTSFDTMTLSQQQQFVALVFPDNAPYLAGARPRWEQLVGGTMRVELMAPEARTGSPPSPAKTEFIFASRPQPKGGWKIVRDAFGVTSSFDLVTP